MPSSARSTGRPRNQTFQGVVVVIIACVIVGAYLWGLDQIIRPVVDRVLL